MHVTESEMLAPDAPVGVLPRAAFLLRLLAGHGDGLRLQEITEVAPLAPPTVHRLLADLVQLGAVERRPGHRYAIGPALSECTSARSIPAPLREVDETRAILQRLADRVGDTVYLAARAFGGAQYLMRCDGDSPIRVFTVEVGEVKPFATSYAGIALLAGLPKDVRADGVAKALAEIPPRWGPRDPDTLTRTLHTLIDQVRDQGWCGGISVIPEVAGIACPIPTSSGAPLFALTISAATGRLPMERIAALVPEMLTAAHQVGAIDGA